MINVKEGLDIEGLHPELKKAADIIDSWVKEEPQTREKENVMLDSLTVKEDNKPGYFQHHPGFYVSCGESEGVKENPAIYRWIAEKFAELLRDSYGVFDHSDQGERKGILVRFNTPELLGRTE